MFFVIFFVHNTHTIDFKIYNIHNFSLKQSRVFVFLLFFFSFFLVIQPHNFMVNTACRFTDRDRKEGSSFLSFFFLQNKQNKEHAHAEKHTTRTNATQG